MLKMIGNPFLRKEPHVIVPLPAPEQLILHRKVPHTSQTKNFLSDCLLQKSFRAKGNKNSDAVIEILQRRVNINTYLFCLWAGPKQTRGII